MTILVEKWCCCKLLTNHRCIVLLQILFLFVIVQVLKIAASTVLAKDRDNTLSCSVREQFKKILPVNWYAAPTFAITKVLFFAVSL